MLQTKRYRLGFLPRERIRMRINIVGSAPGWEDCPVNDGFIWGINNMHLLRDVDLIVDVHKTRNDPKEQKDKIHLAVLKDKNIHAFLHSKIEGMPNVDRYPIEEITKKFGVDYFGCGIDYIVALAIYSGATEIHLYGIWMAQGTEYAHQKPSLEFWLGYAMGAGIKIHIHGAYSAILRTYNGLMYGYETHQKWVNKYFPDQISLAELIERYEREPEKTGIESVPVDM